MNKDNIIDDLKSIIKKKGMKYTEQRAVILKILVNLDEHLNAEDIHAIIQKEHSEHNIGIATIYRTLNFLEEVGLISSISFGTEGKKYEGNTKEHHDHLICTSCNTIIEFLDEQIESKQDEIAMNNNFKIQSHSMQIYGLCEKCQ